MVKIEKLIVIGLEIKVFMVPSSNVIKDDSCPLKIVLCSIVVLQI